MSMLYYWNTTNSQWMQIRRSGYYYTHQNTPVISNDKKSEIKVYPNPADDYVVFDMGNMPGIARLELYDIQGRKVISVGLNDNKQIPVGHLKKGIYLYTIHYSKGMFFGKVAISRK